MFLHGAFASQTIIRTSLLIGVLVAFYRKYGGNINSYIENATNVQSANG
jgi:hypothetical protein